MGWRTWFRGRWERRMDAEFRVHLDDLTHDYMRQGMSRDDAERRARQEFGPIELAKDECRDGRALAWIEGTWRDLRLAVRALRRAPGFALAVALTLALGIGANTAIFSAVHAVLLKPLPYQHPEQLYTVEIVIPQVVDTFGTLTGRIQDYLEWRDADTAFSDVGAMSPARWTLTGSAEPERLIGARVSANFFSLLGIAPAYGTGFSLDNEQPGQDRVVVISDGLWRRRYGADPAIVGQHIELDGQPQRVVGIASPNLMVPTGQVRYLSFGDRIDVWRPAAPTAADLEGENWNQLLLLRLTPGEAPDVGQQQLQAMLNAPEKSLPPGMQVIPYLKPIRDVHAGHLHLRLLLIFGASALLLLVACTNIASLFLARAAGRSAEFATRIALGAGRGGVLRLMLAESLVLAFAGGVLGLVVAYGGIRLLVTFGPNEPLLHAAGIHMPVLVFAVLAMALTGVVCGAVPALQAYRQDMRVALQERSRGALTGRRAFAVRQALVGVEMALGTMLLASAALLLHSFMNVMSADRGYEITNVMTVDLALSGTAYADATQRANFYRALTEQISALPDVLAAGAISQPPVVADADSQMIFLDTDTGTPSPFLDRPIAGIRHVTLGYFAASGTSLAAGRVFETHDPFETAIVSESLARALWPGEATTVIPGRRLRQGSQDSSLLTIVGVVGDVRAGAVERSMPPQIYRPHRPPNGDDNIAALMTVVVKTSSAPETLAPAIRSTIRRLDASLPIPAMRTMEQIVGEAVSERRFQTMLTGLFAVVALLLGGVGVYGVVSYGVACRTREIGLRIALGAVPGRVFGWVLSTGMRPVLVGLAAGMAGAVAIARTLGGVLFEVSPADPIALGSVAVVLLATAAAACYLPARRASRLQPMTALRSE